MGPDDLVDLFVCILFCDCVHVCAVADGVVCFVFGVAERWVDDAADGDEDFYGGGSRSVWIGGFAFE